jgi:hypothetical protein
MGEPFDGVTVSGSQKLSGTLGCCGL